MEKMIKAFGGLILVLIITSCGDNGDNITTTYGTWESSPIVPVNLIEGYGEIFHPVKTRLTISEKYLFFADSLPLLYSSKEKNGVMNITIDQNSFFEYSSLAKDQYDAGRLTPDNLNKKLTMSCKVQDSNVMKCEYAQYWNASRKMIIGSEWRSSQRTFFKNLYTHRPVTFKRVLQPTN